MKKIYATLILSSLIFSVNAQSGRKANNNNQTVSTFNLNRQPNTTAVVVCDSVPSFLATDSLFLYTVPASAGGGYMGGNNGYGDLKKANFTPAALIPAGATITGVFTILYKNTNGNGTKGSGAVSMEILTGDTTTGPTATVLGTAATTMTSVLGGTVVGNSLLYAFTFGTPITAPVSGFFSSLVLPTTAGDTIALYVSRDLSNNMTHNYAWERWSDNTWHSFGDPANWDLKTSLTILPILCYNSTGIHNNVLAANMALYPNPSNGNFSFVMSLPEATNLSVNVTNALGQTVFAKTENNFKAGVLNYDLTSLGKGVYFAAITDNNNNKVVKKVIIE